MGISQTSTPPTPFPPSFSSSTKDSVGGAQRATLVRGLARSSSFRFCTVVNLFLSRSDLLTVIGLFLSHCPPPSSLTGSEVGVERG